MTSNLHRGSYEERALMEKKKLNAPHHTHTALELDGSRSMRMVNTICNLKLLKSHWITCAQYQWMFCSTQHTHKQRELTRRRDAFRDCDHRQNVSKTMRTQVEGWGAKNNGTEPMGCPLSMRLHTRTLNRYLFTPLCECVQENSNDLPWTFFFSLSSVLRLWVHVFRLNSYQMKMAPFGMMKTDIIYLQQQVKHSHGTIGTDTQSFRSSRWHLALFLLPKTKQNKNDNNKQFGWIIRIRIMSTGSGSNAKVRDKHSQPWSLVWCDLVWPMPYNHPNLSKSIEKQI